MAPQILQRLIDASTWNFRFDQRASRAQHDQILKGEQQLASRSARRRHEPVFDQRAQRAAGEPQDSLDVAGVVGLHSRKRSVPQTSQRTQSISRSVRNWPLYLRDPCMKSHLFAVLRAGLVAVSTRLGALRGPSFAAVSLAASVFSRLARSASMRSITLPPVSGVVSDTEIS